MTRSTAPVIANKPVSTRGSRRWRRGTGIGVVIGIAALAVALLPAQAANAAPVYEITARWADGTPSSVKSGDVVTGVWHVNVNDDAAAPVNDPVDNVTVTLTAQNGRFASMPNLCLTGDDVDPDSAISADGLTLTCNLGTKTEGTAATVQAPITVNGASGSQVSAMGSIGGQSAALPPIAITNQFGMDIRWVQGSGSIEQGNGYFETDFEWTLSKLVGSEAGPQTLTYDLTIASPQGGAIQIAPQGCTPFDIALPANGHPWSGGSHPAERMTNFVSSCTVTPLGGSSFRLTLTGIDYDPANPPTRDSAGNRLPLDQVALASGSIWVRIITTQAGSATLTSSAPTYTSVSGRTAVDDSSNNTESKSWTLLGTYSSGWGRGYTNSGGTTWDDTYRVSAGTEVGQYMDTGWQRWPDRPDTQPVGMCAALDTRYVTFDRLEWSNPGPGGVPGATIQYYIGPAPTVDPSSPGYNPDAFSCGDIGPEWVSTLPPDPAAQVRAVRVMMTQGQAEAYANAASITPVVYVDIRPETPPGTDVWSFFQGVLDRADGTPYWTNGSDILGAVTPTPGSRYPHTTGFRDVLRTVTATPWIVKSVDRSVVSPGDPATFTLTYSANGAGAIPATVDGFQIVDTLPPGATYVSGSATPEPALSTNGTRQVLTWTLNGVTTNVNHPLTYQAVVDDSVTPGQALTNNVSASYGGITKTHSAQVTVATDGYTTIGKVADSAYIPNVNGDGVGEGSWTVTLRSFDPLPQDFTDTIDILPYVGDGRGTSFSGTYDLTGVDAAAGATVYYTTADPATLSDDPAHASNGTAAGDVAGNTVGWSTTFTPDATAVRVIGPELEAGATQQFVVNIATDGVVGGDTLVNRAQARAEHTELVMRTSASITVANFYSASLKKYVQDADGTWHDANDVTDYPTYRAGDQVPYRIVIENTGQGTLTDLEIEDSLFPEGSFTVAQLTPGAQEVHEFTVTLTGGGTIVNTACGSAATPDDSGVAPTINCDAAGVEVVNYTTVKSSDPAPGTALQPGDQVVYTVTVTQEGTAPAVAQFTDDLAAVLDDADLTGGPTASVGSATIADGVLSWNGTVPVGAVATVTYTVTVKASSGLAAGGDYMLVNAVASPGCPDAGCAPLQHPIADYTVVKSSDPADGSNVDIGDTIQYTLTVAQVGEAAYQGASLVDDLSDLLDDATWNDDLVASAGAATFDAAAPAVSWSGDLAVDGVVTITYSVTVTGAGDTQLLNVVTSDGCATQASCETEHYTATYTTVKTSNPASGSDVQIGDVITYTITVTQSGVGRVVAQFFNDDLSGALDDATFNNDIAASEGTFSYADGVISWNGDLGPGDVATVTYSVTVTAAGDTLIGNAVQSPGCETAADCETAHQTGRYETVKASDPVSGSDVQIGDTIEYTITVTQIGAGPVEDASFSDDLTAVLDDATWNADLAASSGAEAYAAPAVTWTGDLAVDQVVTVTYSVTVTGTGDMTLTNVVTSDGCVDAASCTTTHQTGDYTIAKTSTPAPGSDVAVGDAITYTVTVVQRGPGAVEGASFDDDLSAVLDDATWDDTLTATSGTASFDPDAESLAWSGDLAVDATVTVTYTVTVTGAGDMTLTNVAVPGADGECVAAPDGNPGCTTTHQTGRFEYAKMADPAHNSDVQAGDVVTYTVTVTQVGPAAVAASVTDDLSDVVDDAAYNGDAAATGGTAAVDGATLSWTGDLAPGDEVAITYSVTVTGAGNTTLANVVTSSSPAGACVTAADGTEGCRTIHKTGGYVYAKSADPAPGASVSIGDTVTYTLTITQRGQGVVTDAIVADDLSGVLDDAAWNGDQLASSGTLARSGDTLTWSGDLAVGQTVTLTYSVRVTAIGPAQLRNVVTSADARAICDPDGICVTTHEVPPPPPLAATGGTIAWTAATLAGLLVAAGVSLMMHRRRREEVTEE